MNFLKKLDKSLIEQKDCKDGGHSADVKLKLKTYANLLPSRKIAMISCPLSCTLWSCWILKGEFSWFAIFRCSDLCSTVLVRFVGFVLCGTVSISASLRYLRFYFDFFTTSRHRNNHNWKNLRCGQRRIFVSLPTVSTPLGAATFGRFDFDFVVSTTEWFFIMARGVLLNVFGPKNIFFLVTYSHLD